MALNLAALFDALARAVPEREAIVFRDRRIRYDELKARTDRLAAVLRAAGLRSPTPRGELRNWQSGQDHVALYMYNGNEYPESLLATLKARGVPVNLNYRYVDAELLHVLRDADARVLIYHGCFADTVARLRDDLPSLTTLIQVDEGGGAPLLDGALDYEAAIAAAPETAVDADALSPDDLYMIYTGGTTGMPKGVLWRQGDFIPAMLGMKDETGRAIGDSAAIVAKARVNRPSRSLAAPPYMHGTGQLVSFIAWLHGNTVVLQDNVQHLDAAGLLAVAEREQVRTLSVVGDAFARVIAEEMERGDYDLSSLRLIVNGGATFSPQVKERIMAIYPKVSIFDAFGSTESGPQGVNVTSRGRTTETTFKLEKAGVALNADKTGPARPDDEAPGWFAARGHIPLGYLNDEAKTAATFPVVAGVRHAVPGDRVRLREDGSMIFLGRDSVTINSGGEKIYAEEVEEAIKRHADVVDVIVSSRPSERFGREVVAIVETRAGRRPGTDSLNAVAGERIARYKQPKAYLFVDQVRRGQNGKADYRWAQALAEGSLEAAGTVP